MKCIILRRKWLSLAACAIIAICMLVFVNHPVFVSTSATTRDLPIYSVSSDYPVCAFSFDASWGDSTTAGILEVLDRYQIKTTFFVVGDWVSRYPETVKAISDAGHEVMNHSDGHGHFNTYTPDQIMADIELCNEKIEEITGICPTLFRPPYGEYNDRVVSTVRSCGMETVQWDVEGSHITSSC